jgi:hypothetical protein
VQCCTLKNAAGHPIKFSPWIVSQKNSATSIYRSVSGTAFLNAGFASIITLLISSKDTILFANSLPFYSLKPLRESKISEAKFKWFKKFTQ